MKIPIKLFSPNGHFLEEIKIIQRPVEFLLYRGRLFQRVPGTDNFKQKQYVEIS